MEEPKGSLWTRSSTLRLVCYSVIASVIECCSPELVWREHPPLGFLAYGGNDLEAHRHEPIPVSGGGFWITFIIVGSVFAVRQFIADFHSTPWDEKR